MKKLTSFVVALAVPLLITAWTVPAAGQDTTLAVHGFGGWAAGHTNNDNIYPDTPLPIASKDWSIDNSYFTLNLLARPVDKVTILAQPTWQSSMRGQEVRLDLAYVELEVVPDLLVRAGKIKNPLGLYMDIYKVGTLRPFYLLPNSYYRLSPESYSGIGVNHVQHLGAWEVELDVLGGQMDFESAPSDVIAGQDPESGDLIFASLPIVAQGRDVIGGGAALRTPIEGLELRASAYTIKLYGSVAGGPYQEIDEKRLKAYAGALEYVNEKVSLRSEGIMTKGPEKDYAWYAELAYYLTSHWQIAGTYQYVNFKEPPPIVKDLEKDNTFGFALNYWVNPKLVWKVDYYHVTNNRAARLPAEAALNGELDTVNAALLGQLDKKTDVIIAGVHFAF